MDSTIKRTTIRGLWGAACIIALAIQPFTASPAVAVTTLPVLWTAGGHSAGVDSAGNSARMASDARAILPSCLDRHMRVILP